MKRCTFTIWCVSLCIFVSYAATGPFKGKTSCVKGEGEKSLERKSLNIFTKVSFFTALVTIIIFVPTFILTSAENNVGPILGFLLSLAFCTSLFGFPLSIVSMFSKENLIKRFFVLIVNSLPISLYVFALTMEFIRVFFETPS